MKMKKNLLRATLLLSLCVFVATPAFAATKKDVDKAKTTISSLEEEKKKTEKAIKELEDKKKDTEQYVRSLDSKLAALDKELDDLEKKTTKKEEEITLCAAQLEEAMQEERRQYDSMKLRIKYMYEKGDSSFLDMILKSGSMSELLSRSEYISKISDYDRKMLGECAKATETVKQERENLETEKSELLKLTDATKAKQSSIESLVNEKTNELNRMDREIGQKEAEAKAYEKDIRAQEAAIAKIEAELKRQEEEAKKKAEAEGKKYQTVSLGNIKFQWPIPASSKITSKFGVRESPTQGASTNHKGIDVSASTGSNILAAAAGTVSIATYSYSAGNYVMINHGGGVTTVYMHCSKLLVAPGATVKKGDVIAKVGSTGYSTGPHLHFGIRQNGTYLNPLNYVSP